MLLRASVRLTLYAAELAVSRLQALPDDDVDPSAALDQLLLRHGARRREASVRKPQTSDSRPGSGMEFWRLTGEDLDELFLLLALIDNKTCDYQQRSGRSRSAMRLCRP